MYKIMLADDEGIVIDSLKFIIEKEFKDTCEVQYAKTGRSVIELAESFRPDVAVMDIQMPVMNGYEATANIRAGKSDYWKTIPVIAMTANVFQEDESRAAECGMSDYVTKPIDMNVIYSVLEKWLRGQKG